MAAQLRNGRRSHRNRWSPLIWGGAAALLSVPWVAMRFTAEVNWTGSDFLVMGAVLAIACGAYEIAARASGSFAYRVAAGIAILAGFLLVWVNLAVGVVGETTHPANLMFVGVLLVGIVGALVARLRAQGMAKALAATAATQALACAVGLFFFRAEGPRQAMALAILTAILVAAWLLSAWLFRRAARPLP